MSKFKVSMVEALECALHNAEDGDFLREVADALENGRNAILWGRSMSVEIELPGRGSSVWELRELGTAPSVTYKFMREVIEK